MSAQISWSNFNLRFDYQLLSCNTSIWKIVCNKQHFFFANRKILRDRSVSISKRLKYFNAVVSSVACCGSRQRAIYNSQLVALDIHFRKLYRSMVGLPLVVAWNVARTGSFHGWTKRVRGSVANALAWSISSKNYWNLAEHVAGLPAHRWVKRLLSYHPVGVRRVGRPRHTWEPKLTCNKNVFFTSVTALTVCDGHGTEMYFLNFLFCERRRGLEPHFFGVRSLIKLHVVQPPSGMAAS